MIDVLRETCFPLSEARKHGIDRSRWTLWKYQTQGKRRADGKLIYLEKCILTGGVGTSAQAWQRFIARINRQMEGDGRA